MKSFYAVFTAICCSTLFSVLFAQNPKAVLHPETGAYLRTSRVAAYQNSNLLIGASNRYFSSNSFQCQQLFALDGSAITKVALPDYFQSTFNIPVNRAYDIPFSKWFSVLNNNAYFVVSGTGSTYEYTSWNYNFENRELNKLELGKAPGYEIVSLADELFIPFGSPSADSAAVVINDLGEKQLLKRSAMRFENGGFSKFIGDKYTSVSIYYIDGRRRYDVAVFDSITAVQRTYLLPTNFYDTISGNTKDFINHVKVVDSLIYFIYNHLGDNYHEYAMYVSKGEANDAVKLTPTYIQKHYDNSGSSSSYGESPQYQDFGVYNGELYFGGMDGIFKTNGTVAGTEKLPLTEKIYSIDGYKYWTKFLLLQGNTLYYKGFTEANEYVICSYNLDTQEKKVIKESLSRDLAMRQLNDSLIYITDYVDGITHMFVYRMNSEELTEFYSADFENHTDEYNAYLVNQTLYFHGMEGGEVLMQYNLNESITSIAENENGNWKMFPNPTGNSVRFSNTKWANSWVTITLLDISGKTVLQQQHNLTNALQVAHLQSGMYVVKISNENELLSAQKLLIH